MTRGLSFKVRWEGTPVVFGGVGRVVPASIEPVDGRRAVGGPVCDAVYRVANAWAYSRFLTNMAVVSRDGDTVTVELCHTWRVIRGPAGSMSFTRWDPLEDAWQEVSAAAVPDVSLFAAGGRANVAKRMIESACSWYVGRAAQSLRLSMSDFIREACGVEDAIRLAALILKEDRVRHKVEFESLASAGSVVGAGLWALVDRDVLKDVCRMHMKPTIRDYARAANNIAGIRRVSTEHRNLLPLLRAIPQSEWDRPNLFAHYRWRDATAAPLHFDRQVVGATVHSRLAWRYFLSAPAPLHAAWLRCFTVGPTSLRFDTLYEIVARTRSTTQSLWKIRVVRALESLSYRFERTLADVDLNMLGRLVDCFFSEAARLQREQGWRHAIKHLTYDHLVNLLDWWFADGRARALPDRQSTWASMNRAARAWEQIRRYGDVFATWCSALGRVQIDEVEVIPLDTGAKLVEEGEVMHHCVADYIEFCRDRDDQRIFSLRWKDERSTLRIAKRADGWAVAENRSHGNVAPHAALVSIGPKVALAYTAAERESAHEGER